MRLLILSQKSLFSIVRDDLTSHLWFVNQFLEKRKLTGNIHRKVKQEQHIININGSQNLVCIRIIWEACLKIKIPGSHYRDSVNGFWYRCVLLPTTWMTQMQMTSEPHLKNITAENKYFIWIITATMKSIFQIAE